MNLHRVLGTAGHIDHGKTSLVKALTGIDTDRLKEEQERGITIELGFAHLKLPSGDVVGVVDVPGHERFIRTMVSGAVGIDAVVLVVAADEGVMPQTREHLDICELLGVRAGVVALSKSDLCEPELRELATLELRETLRGTFLAQAPIVACSAKTGQGLPELVAAIAKVLAAAPGRDEQGLVRLPVDRVFSLHGFGTVATGTLWSGRLRVGDELVPLPGPRSERLPPAKVRGLHVHGAAVLEATAGQRTAVNLTLPLHAVSRGETLVRPATLQAGVLLDVRLQLLTVARAPLPQRSRLLLHAGTTQRLAQVTLLDRAELRPGEWAWAQLQVDAPLCAQPGDRFVLRGFAPQKNHGTTVGGGMVLRVLGARHRRGTPELCARLSETAAALSDLSVPPRRAAAIATLLRLELARRGLTGASFAGLRLAVPVGEEPLAAALRAELRAGTVRELAAGTAEASPPGSGGSAAGAAGIHHDTTYLSSAAFALVGAEILGTIQAYHKSAPRNAGLPKEALRLQLGHLGAPKPGSAAPPVAAPPSVQNPKPTGKPAGPGKPAAAQSSKPAPPPAKSLDLGEGPKILCPPRLLQAVVESLVKTGQLVADRELLRLPTHRVVSDAAERQLSDRVAAVYLGAGLGPPRLEELGALLGAAADSDARPPGAAATSAAVAAEVKQTVETLVRAGTLVRIKDLLFHRQPLAELRQRLIDFLKRHHEINPTQWKDLVGQSRKFTIPLAEHFDAEKLTLRVGDLRRLRAAPSGPA